ncbi:MAG: hypothetical protein AB8C13_02690 [Phycisphaerales bacterium]
MNLFNINAALVLVILLGSLVVTGCESKKQQHEKQMAADLDAAKELAAISQQNKDRLVKQLETEGGFMPSSNHELGEFVDSIEDSAEDLTPEFAANLKAQAAILKQVKDLMDPYLELNNAFMKLGGIEASTLGSVGDITNRILMVEQLNAMNERITLEYPVLYMQVRGADTPSGINQLEMFKEIRQADREAYPYMKRCLEIVRQYRDTSGNANDGNFYFGDDVPGEIIGEYNENMAAIAAIGERQFEIQRRTLNSP